MKQSPDKLNCQHKSVRAAGFTLVELLVVIAIIGVLMAMIIPAVNAVRGRARALQCSNNLKQIGLACISYESLYKYFPPAAVPTKIPTSPTAEPETPSYKNQRQNWLILILPQIDQIPLYDEFNDLLKKDVTKSTADNLTSSFSGKTITVGQNDMATLRKREISSFKCPSDIYARTSYQDGNGNAWARGNYGANMGLATASKTGLLQWWASNKVKGVMGYRYSSRSSDIQDGASNTILCGELRAGVAPEDPRGVWALGGAGTSGAAACGIVLGNDRGPNAPASGDSIEGCSGILTASELDELKMPCQSGSAGNNQATFRSMHAGGVNVVYADGSTHWIADSVDVGAGNASVSENLSSINSNQKLSIWDCLILSADGKSISLENQ